MTQPPTALAATPTRVSTASDYHQLSSGRLMPESHMAEGAAYIGRHPQRSTATRTGSAEAQHGGAANSGTVGGDLRNVTNNYYGTPPRADFRAAYLGQVRQIAPEILADREAELAELAAFTAPETTTDQAVDPIGFTAADDLRASEGGAVGCYRWWRAEAKAGKSALMAWFVLHPPPGVDVVAFFITARYAGHNTRAMFLETVIPQLATLAGQDAGLATGEEHQTIQFYGLLEEATLAVVARGRRLVLVVDGIDEDAGVTARPGARSIAGLLPDRPPSNMRIIVAGRPNPPIPGDLGAGHPLRHGGIVRELTVSPHAKMAYEEAEHALRELIEDQGIGHEILGLLTAAGGGLTIQDLTHLTDSDTPYPIRKLLNSAASRTFTPRNAHYVPDGASVYILGHEELQRAAYTSYGPRALARYRERLHQWADEYRELQWPVHTPDYLMRGYPQLLVNIGTISPAERADNAARLTTMATDVNRQERLLNLTGGDSAALSDILRAERLHHDTEQPSSQMPNLADLARLSVHFDCIRRRNEKIPAAVPVLWSKLGNTVRAINLALSFARSDWTCSALVDIAWQVKEAGDDMRAAQLFEEAAAIARTITEPQEQAIAQRDLACYAAKVGDHERAEIIGRPIADPHQQAIALISVAQSIIKIGDHERAAQLLREVETTARTISKARWRVANMSDVACSLREAGDNEYAIQLIHECEAISLTILETHWKSAAKTDMARSLIRIGEKEHASQKLREAEKIARAAGEAHLRAGALSYVAQGFIVNGEIEHGIKILHEAETSAQAITDPSAHGAAMDAITQGFAEAIDLERAEVIARNITQPHWKASALSYFAHGLVEVGDNEQATRILHEIEIIARTAAEPHTKSSSMADVALCVAKAGNKEQSSHLFQEAECIARSTVEPHWKTTALSYVARGLIETGDNEHGAQVLREAEISADTITDPSRRASALSWIARDFAAGGNIKHAVSIARANSDPFWRVTALARIALHVADTGDNSQATRLLLEAERVTSEITNTKEKISAQTDVSRVFIETGDNERGIQLLREAEINARANRTESERHDTALANIAHYAAKSGDSIYAEAVTRAIMEPHWQATSLIGIAYYIAEAGDDKHAIQILREAEAINRSVVEVSWKGQLLADIAHSFYVHDREYSAQMAHEAESIAEASTNTRQHAQTLSACARLYFLSGATGRGKLALAKALRNGRWQNALEPLIESEKGISMVIAEELRKFTY
ncbi:hypothetical protein ACWGNE_08405 [Streptomyces xiamenensis]